MLPRGIRNNNPMNVLYDRTTNWLGETAPDGAYCRFYYPKFGIRAGCKVLLTYQRLYKLCTIQAIITRYAPPPNDTAAYIADVSAQTGIAPDAVIDMTLPATLTAIATAIIRHENGQQPYSDIIIEQGVALALTNGEEA